MDSRLTLKEKIRDVYFELIADIAYYSHGTLLQAIVDRLQVVLNTSNTAIYVYNDWTDQYELGTASHHASLQNILTPPYIWSNTESVADGKVAFQNSSDSRESVIIPLYPKYKPACLLFLTVDDNRSLFHMDSIAIIKHETEQLLKLVNYYRQSKTSEQRNKFLFDMSSRLYSMTRKEEILAEIVQGLQELYPNFSYYILLSQDYDSTEALPVKTIEYSDDATKMVSTQAFLTGEVQLEDRIKEKNTCLYAPLKGKQGIYGVLQVITPHEIGFPQEEISFITKFSETAGAAFENVTLYQHSNHLVEDLKLLNEATHKLNSNLRLNDIIMTVRHQIMNACGATQVGVVYLKDGDREEYDILTGSTNYFKTSEGKMFAASIFERVRADREPVLSGDFNATDLFVPYRSVIAVPMVQSDIVHGVTVIMSEEKYYFSFDSFKLIQSLVQHSTLALTNAVLRNKLEMAVKTDYLTKLYSRNYLDEMLKLHMENEEKGTLILFDIDDFKKINDTYGHYIGDEVIVQVADIIRDHLGMRDIAARWGGEELAVYLPDADIEDGLKLAGAIRRQAANFTEPSITMSCGVASWTDKANDSASEVFLRADKALYEAKSIGKNCVVREKGRPKKSVDVAD
ncbi:diguanylate cyclase domain-containing protein [Virgibacillus kekensis]|uniref:Diguanylate cyclase domain-containing protein n=1 Tax=Virgibacillus kekensis TaxID=202261 RepID=A0ABV9DDD0_9BACI